MYGEQRDRELLAEAQQLLALGSGSWRVVRYAQGIRRAAKEISGQSSAYLPRNTVSRPIQVHGQHKLPLI